MEERFRDIIFRGKSIDKGEWVYGNLVQSPDGSMYILTDKATLEGLDIGGWIETWLIEVDPKTIGQRTDFIDKNGFWIYEGDLLKIPEHDPYHPEKDFDYIARISWGTWFDCTGWYLVPVPAESYSNPMTHISCSTSIIVGNIHDNSEMSK